jgi:hypothetical protein
MPIKGSIDRERLTDGHERAKHRKLLNRSRKTGKAALPNGRRRSLFGLAAFAKPPRSLGGFVGQIAELMMAMSAAATMSAAAMSAAAMSATAMSATAAMPAAAAKSATTTMSAAMKAAAAVSTSAAVAANSEA